MSISISKKIAVIAGQTDLPLRVAEHCNAALVVGIKGQTDASLYQDFDYDEVKLGQIGKLIKCFKNHDIEDFVMIGAVKRPNLSDLALDLEGTKIAAKFGLEMILGKMGDDGLLRTLRTVLESYGYRLIGPHRVMPELLLGSGVIGKQTPSKQDMIDIERGREVALGLGVVDVGQAVIVQEGVVLGVEAIEGTDALIRRCADLRHGKKRAGVLVKCMKPNQDPDLDVPTIGVKTLEILKASGFSGVAALSGKTLVANVAEVQNYADKNGLFVYGMSE